MYWEQKFFIKTQYYEPVVHCRSFFKIQKLFELNLIFINILRVATLSSKTTFYVKGRLRLHKVKSICYLYI